MAEGRRRSDGTSSVPFGEEDARGASRPRPWILALVVGLAVVAVVVVVMVVRGGSVPGVTPVVLPTPTPTVSAADRERTTAFQQALPDEVLAFAVAGQEGATDLVDAGAVEAYRLVYTDGQQEVVLRAGQWPTADEAATAMSTLLAVPAEEPTPGATGTGRDEPVVVGGEPVGRLIVVDDGTTARATWTNHSTVFQLEGPSGVVSTFYDAFPM